MWIARDKNGSISLFIDKPHRKNDIEWKSLDYYPLTLTEKKYRNDSSYYYSTEYIELPEDIRKITWEDEPVEITLKQEDNGLMYLCRDENGSLQLFFVKPYRNEMHNWWSGPDRCTIIEKYLHSIVKAPEEDMKYFENLTWNDEPIKVNFEIK